MMSGSVGGRGDPGPAATPSFISRLYERECDSWGPSVSPKEGSSDIRRLPSIAQCCCQHAHARASIPTARLHGMPPAAVSMQAMHA